MLPEPLPPTHPPLVVRSGVRETLYVRTQTMKEDHMNDVSRREFVSISLGSALAGWLASSQAQTGQTGKLLVGYPAGGSLDVTARQLAEAWRKAGRIYIVDNRPGAGGRIANSHLKRERPDGNTLLVTHS